MWIRKSRCIESNWTCYFIGEFNVTLSLCGVLGVALYFLRVSWKQLLEYQ